MTQYCSIFNINLEFRARKIKKKWNWNNFPVFFQNEKDSLPDKNK